MISVIDWANLSMAGAALCISVYALYTAKKTENKSVASSFLLDKYHEVYIMLFEYNVVNINTKLPKALTMTRDLLKYDVILNASGHSKEFASLRETFEAIICHSEAVNAYHQQGKSYEEIAALMGDSVSPVKLVEAFLVLKKSVQNGMESFIKAPLDRIVYKS